MSIVFYRLGHDENPHAVARQIRETGKLKVSSLRGKPQEEDVAPNCEIQFHDGCRVKLEDFLDCW